MKKLRILLILTSILFSKFSFADVEKINNEQLKNLIGSKAIPLIDIRTPKEWLETGVIKGSYLILEVLKTRIKDVVINNIEPI